jgi:hypothetical protein
MTVATSLVTVIIMTITTAITTLALIVSSASALTIALYVLFVVPPILHEIDRLSTGVVLVAMLAPVLRLAWRHAQVDRLAYHLCRRLLNHDRLPVDNARLREVADVNAAIEAGVANLDGYANIGGKCGSSNRC